MDSTLDKIFSQVSSKVAVLKSSLEREFSAVVELCIWVFDQYVRQPPGAIKASLVCSTLETLSKFLGWINLQEIFSTNAFGTNLLSILFNNFWDPLQFRVDCLKCLNEIASRDPKNKDASEVATYKQNLRDCFIATVQKIHQLPTNHLQLAVENGPQREYWRNCVNQITLLLSKYYTKN